MEVNEKDIALQHDFDFACLDLKANRYKAAEIKYELIVKNTNHYGAWCGLGMAKLGLLLENVSTVEEIEYCFAKAKMNDESKIEEVEILYAKSAFDLIKVYYQFFQNNAALSKELTTNVIAGIGAAFAGGFVSGGSNSFTGKLMGVGIAGIGMLQAGNALHKQKDIRIINQQILETAEKLYISVKSFVTVDNPLIEQSEHSYVIAKNAINNYILSSEKKGGVYEKWYHNNWYLALSFLFFWPLFIYGIIMRFKTR